LVAAGTLAILFTIIVGAMYEACPFQSSFSNPLRNLYLASSKLPKDAKEILGDPRIRTRVRTAIAKMLRDLIPNIRTWLRETRVRIREEQAWWVIALIATKPVAYPITAGLKRLQTKLQQIIVWSKEGWKVEEEEWICAHSATWMAETAPELVNIITVAKNLPLVTHQESLRFISRSKAFPWILYWLRSSLLALRDEHRTTDNVDNAVTMASAVAHIVLADPGNGAERLLRVFESVGSLEWLVELCGKESDGLEALMIHLLAIARVFPKPDSKHSSKKLLVVDASLRKGLQRCTRAGVAATTHLHHFILDAPSDPARWGDTRHKIDEISKTLLSNTVNVNPEYVMCASWALSLTLRGSRIFQGDSLSTPSNPPLGDEKSVWDARQGNSFANRLLEALEAFYYYYSNARHASPPRHIYSRVLDCQRQLLAHAKTLNLSDDVTLQYSRHPTTFFQTMHRILNRTILEVLQVRHEILHPPIDAAAFQDCLHLLVDYLRDLLLTPGAQWLAVDHDSLRLTALLAREPKLASKHPHLVEAILYRGFVHQSLYAGLNAGPFIDERRSKLSRDRRIGPALISALRLYLGLYPSTTHADIWSIFCRYLLFLSTGHLQKGVHVMRAIDLIPSTTAVLPCTAAADVQVPPAARMTPSVVAADTGISPSEVTADTAVALLTEDPTSVAAAAAAVQRLATTRRTPAITVALNFYRYLPRIPLPQFYDGIDDEDDGKMKEKVERTVVDVCRGWNLENHTMMGSCMVWLAESFRHKEAWATKVDGTGVIQLFVAVMKGQREVLSVAQLASWNNKKPKQDVQADAELWSSVDVTAAGALFLRAWKADVDTVKDARVADGPGWTDTATIEAFATWLPTLDSNGKIMIKEKDDDMPMAIVQTTIEVSLVTSFLDQASEKNREAVKRFGLDSTLQKTREDMEEKRRNIDIQKQERLKREQEQERLEQ
ncbi:hypothetical protein FRB97_009337, partial [Tulasnella sp. 331]